ncbi:aspartate aminotransferase [Fusarium austroafricanum]|uniref:Aspartate aminotransferase n=1 Tax=Fusarium austroafricanum TaxID=2364996 RepID=A0A8H4JXW3_9HYPO|nr:aspartate aminotransferase [Fusarium austroafricanum]
MTPSLSTPRQTQSGKSTSSSSSTDKTAPTSSSSSSISRLNSIVRHISPKMVSTTNFPAEVVPQAPEDPLFGLARAYKADESSNKIDLGIGAYRDENAKPWVLPVVKKCIALPRTQCPARVTLSKRIRSSSSLLRNPPIIAIFVWVMGVSISQCATWILLMQICVTTYQNCPAATALRKSSVLEFELTRRASQADEILRNDPELNHEYAPIAGIASFTSKAAELVFGADSAAIQEKRSTTLQTISGTGAVHLGALFLAKFYKGNQTVYLSNPTWANHHQIFKNVGLSIDTYPYFHKETKGLDFEGLKQTLQSAPEGSVFVLHACAHNPTGVDPTQEQWTEIAAIMKERNHFPFFDTAYQGFASGDLVKDAWAIRYFVEQGFELVVAQSFAKNFGLYGERAGCFHAVTSPAGDASHTITRIGSQLAILQRSEISNPPLYGARIVSTVLNDRDLFAEWEENLRTMSGRIINMRDVLRAKLEELQTPGTWNHITDQIGMFSFTGLSESQVMKLREEFHIYMTKNGRISMAGLNDNNVEYFAKAVDEVVRDSA